MLALILILNGHPEPITAFRYDQTHQVVTFNQTTVPASAVPSFVWAGGTITLTNDILFRNSFER